MHLQPAQLTLTTCARIPSVFGEFRLCHYVNQVDGKEHLALILGDVTRGRNVLVRIHSECFTGDVLGSLRCDCGEQLAVAMQRIAEEACGVLVYLRQEGRGIGLANKLRAYELQDEGYDTVEANLMLGHQADEREYSAAAAILADLGVQSVRLLTNNPDKIEKLMALGIQVTERIPVQVPANAHNAAYLRTKVVRMRHLLDPQEVFASEAEHINGHFPQESQLPYAPWIEDLRQRAGRHFLDMGRPFVTVSYAQSLDGSIAARPGQPLRLSSPASMTLTHALRAAHEAILAGVETVLADDPQLTVRLVSGPSPRPVIVDTHLRTPPDARVIQAGNRPLIAAGPAANPAHAEALEAAGATVMRLPLNARGQIDLAALIGRLGELGLTSVMVEGGARILTSFLGERLADYAVVTLAPVYVGGYGVFQPRRDDPAATVGAAGEPRALPRLENPSSLHVGPDLTLWGRFSWE